MQPSLFIPELKNFRQGKVRDIYETHNDELVLVASNRLSVFDRILNEPIRDKGRILTELAHFWFLKTQDIITNHVLSRPDPNVMVVKKCTPIPLEVIVRGYMTGSIWRDYEKGAREKCGVKLPDGLKQNDPFPTPIVTPTTKSHDGHDEDITKEEIFAQKIVEPSLWQQIETTALRLYQRGTEVLKERGMILVDTKYEFGLDSAGKLILIDEIHTPDSSRFWFQKDLEKKEVRFPDKEFARQWARGQGFTGDGLLPSMPDSIQEQIYRGYKEVCQAITGQSLTEESDNLSRRIGSNLRNAQLIQDRFALIVLGSDKDREYADKMGAVLAREKIGYRVEVSSAHKRARPLLDLVEQHNHSLTPIVHLTVAGRSNALSGVVAAHSKWPVIACPFFKDGTDYLINIHSSLQMPSQTPVLTCVDPENAALAAVRILKLGDR